MGGFLRRSLVAAASCNVKNPPMTEPKSVAASTPRKLRPLPKLIFTKPIFMRRWLQLPRYLGLILAQTGIDMKYRRSAAANANYGRLMTGTQRPARLHPH